MKDERIQKSLAELMIGGVIISAAIMLAGLIWFVLAHPTMKPGDRIFAGEPTYFENPVSMVQRALEAGAIGERRSVVMLGVILLLINPVVRVTFAAVGFAAQKDILYVVISLTVLAVLLLSFFW